MGIENFSILTWVLVDLNRIKIWPFTQVIDIQYVTIISLELILKSIGTNFSDKLITNIVENYKYEDITSRHQHEKGGNPRMLKNRKNETLGWI
jgi:hypothetical protein